MRETYSRQHAYSSHTNLTLEESQGIEKSCFDEIPNTINVKGVEVEIQNEIDGFTFIIEAHENPGKSWKANPSGWFVHIPTGLKVRLNQTASPDYHKLNGCGTGRTDLEVIIPD